MKPSAPALATAATSSARPTHMHAALDDRVLDPEHLREACLQHPYSPSVLPMMSRWISLVPP